MPNWIVKQASNRLSNLRKTNGEIESEPPQHSPVEHPCEDHPLRTVNVELTLVGDQVDEFPVELQDSAILSFLPLPRKQSVFATAYQTIDQAKDSFNANLIINQTRRRSANLYLHLPHNPLHRAILSSHRRHETRDLEILEGRNDELHKEWSFDKSENAILDTWLAEHLEDVWTYRRGKACGEENLPVFETLPGAFKRLVSDLRLEKVRITRLSLTR